MTKLMFCGECGDVVSPGLKEHDVRWCACKRHAVWWENGAAGQLRVHDAWMVDRNAGDGGKAWVIGLHNGVLREGGFMAHTGTPVEEVDGVTMRGNLITRRHWVERLLAQTPDSYLFKRANSLVVRIAPGASNDTAWSRLPDVNRGGEQ
jgi:hypothetical protein